MIPFPQTVRPDQQPPAAVCTCHHEQVSFCEVCNEYSDCCLSCLPQPKCTCVQVDVDIFDAADCELCDPDSHYNWLLAKAEKTAAARPKPVTRAEVLGVFDDILNSIRRVA